MDALNEDKMKVLVKKSQYQFLTEKKEEINLIMKHLLYFATKPDKNDYEAIHRFFHSVKGTAGTLELQDISKIAEHIQLLLEDNEEDCESLKDQEILTVVKSLGEILVMVEEHLETDFPKNEVNTGDNTTLKDSVEKKLLQEDSPIIRPTGKILVIDDEVAMLDFLGNILRHHNYDVMISSNPEEALETIKNETLDLVIVDVVMPGKSGFDIHHTIIEEKINVPVVFLTGLQNKEVRYQALRDGVDHFLQKPIEPAELLSRVEGIMKKQHNRNTEVFTDELTGAYTRKFFAKRFEEERQRHIRKSKPFSIAFLDLDYFKAANDTYGHLFGDEVLKRFVEIINRDLREYDQVFRYGGDEFLLLFPETTDEEAYMIVERIRNTAKKKIFVVDEDEKDYKISFSSGIAMMEEKELSMIKLMERADAALYQAKEKGRNQTVYQLGKKNQRRKKILIVDDVRFIANLIKTRLAYLDYEIEQATDGEEALEKIKSFYPDLVLLDIMLPKLTGTEVLKRIKEDPSFKDLKIIMISARNKDKDILNNIRLGANDFITKPFSLEVLEEKIKKLL